MYNWRNKTCPQMNPQHEIVIHAHKRIRIIVALSLSMYLIVSLIPPSNRDKRDGWIVSQIWKHHLRMCEYDWVEGNPSPVNVKIFADQTSLSQSEWLALSRETNRGRLRPNLTTILLKYFLSYDTCTPIAIMTPQRLVRLQTQSVSSFRYSRLNNHENEHMHVLQKQILQYPPIIH